MSTESQALTFGVLEDDLATYQMGPSPWLFQAVYQQPFLAVDIETGRAGTDRQWDVKAVSVATPERSWVLDPAVHGDVVREVMAKSRALVFHNAPYDLPIMVNAGLAKVSDVDRVHDTILLSRLARPSEHGGNTLGEAGDRYIGPGYNRAKKGVEMYMKRAIGAKTKGEVFDRLGLESPAYVMYAAFDTVATARLFQVLPNFVGLHHADHPFTVGQYATAEEMTARETTVMRVLLRRSCRGLLMADDDQVDIIKHQFNKQVDAANGLLAGFGIDIDESDPKVRTQVMEVLDRIGALGPNWKRTMRGAPSGDAKALEQLPHPLAQAWLQRSVASNYVNKFIDQYFLPYQGKVWPRVSVAAAVTGRMSYSGPPLQQIPPEVRPMVRHDRPMTSFDWSSIEPVLWFNATKEYGRVEAFESGGDLYQPIADDAGVSRKQAKVVLLAQIYGQGIKKLAAQLGVSEDEARRIRDSVSASMPESSKAVRALTAVGKTHGRVLTMYGRNVPIEPDPSTGNHQYFGYKGVNYFVQGSAYDLLADSIVRLEQVGAGDSIILAIHDELVVEDEAADTTQEIMTTAPDWLVRAVDRNPVLRVGRTPLGTTWVGKE